MNKQQGAPRARSEGLVVMELGEETLVYDLGSYRAHCLNRTAAAVWRWCDGRRGAEGLAREVGREVGQEVSAEVVWLALGQLSRARLLEGAGVWVRREGPTRREMLKRGAVAAAMIPAVVTITAPQAQAAASNCTQRCTTDGDCAVLPPNSSCSARCNPTVGLCVG